MTILQLDAPALEPTHPRRRSPLVPTLKASDPLATLASRCADLSVRLEDLEDERHGIEDKEARKRFYTSQILPVADEFEGEDRALVRAMAERGLAAFVHDGLLFVCPVHDNGMPESAQYSVLQVLLEGAKGAE